MFYDPKRVYMSASSSVIRIGAGGCPPNTAMSLQERPFFAISQNPGEVQLGEAACNFLSPENHQTSVGPPCDTQIAETVACRRHRGSVMDLTLPTS